MQKIWLQSYPANVAHEVDVHQFTSLTQLLEQSFKKNAANPFSVC
ncbi:MAG: long-chain fatty acid--CoA ligase, partial [Rhodoferax sp.]|nr:long-chain fatty acid--CoA ligase [Rhodoferax sp.]